MLFPRRREIQSRCDQARVWIPAYAGMTMLPMPCVLGLDIGTTSTIGVLIRPPDETLALASRPVALRSDHVGWAEEDPEQWWSNVGEIVRELLRNGGVSAADIAAVGVTGMLPAVVLLNDAGRLLRPSIQQSDARCGTEVDELRAEIDEKAFLAKAGNGINQQLVAAKLRWIERHEPNVFARIADIVRLVRLYQLAPHRGARHRTELGARGWLRRPQDGRDRRRAGRACAYPAGRPAPQDRLARNPRQSVGARRGGSGLKPGTPVIGGAADHIASALGAGIVNAGDVLLKFGGSVFSRPTLMRSPITSRS